jgi:hypothetical protein
MFGVIRLRRSTPTRARSARPSALGLDRLGVDRVFVSGPAFLQMFPVNDGILQNFLGDLEMRRVLQGDGMQSITVERENLRAGKRQ